MSQPFPPCQHCTWQVYPVRLVEGRSALWYDVVHDDIRCLVNPTGVHEPECDPLDLIAQTVAAGLR